MARAVFFDLGGTLLVMRRDRVMQEVMRDEGHEFDIKRIHASFNSMEEVWLKQYASAPAVGEQVVEAYRRLDAMVIEDLLASGQEVSRLSAMVRNKWRELRGTMPPELFPDVEPVLSSLVSQGVSLGLVSNAPPDTAKTVDELGLRKYIGNVVISGIVGFSKPNPEIFRIALANSRVQPGETIHVGDIYSSDVAGARNAGIKGVLLDRDGVAGETDCPVIRGLDEVLQIAGLPGA